MKLIYGITAARKRAKAGKEDKVRILTLYSSSSLFLFVFSGVFFWSHISIELAIFSIGKICICLVISNSCFFCFSFLCFAGNATQIYDETQFILVRFHKTLIYYLYFFKILAEIPRA